MGMSKIKKNTIPSCSERKIAIHILGIVELSLTIFAVYAFVSEFRAFSLFSLGGRFAIDGFGFGSFMFGIIVLSAVIYGFISVITLALAIGNLTIKKWSIKLHLILLLFCVGLGIILIVGLLSIIPSILNNNTSLISDRNQNISNTILILLLVGFTMVLIPALLIKFYRSTNVQSTFENSDPKEYWIDKYPITIILLLALFIFYFIMNTILVLFNSPFLLFGRLLSGPVGTLAIIIFDVFIAITFFTMLRRNIIGWWASLIFFFIFTVSSVVTFPKYSILDIYVELNFPENPAVVFLGSGVIKKFNLTVPITTLLIITILLILIIKKSLLPKKIDHYQG